MKKKRFGVTAVALLMAATAAFASCGKDDNGNGKLDGNTDIADVKSETVADDAAWKAAFAREKYTNYSYKMTEKDTRGTGAEAKTEDTVIEYKLEEKKAFYAVQTSKDEEAADGNTQRKTERYETYIAEKDDVLSAYVISYADGVKISAGVSSAELHPEYAMMVSGEMGYMSIGSMAEIDFADVKYDETAKGYVYSSTENGMTGTATIKILNGMLAGFISSFSSGEGEDAVATVMSLIVYDVGNTEITLPDAFNGHSGNRGDEEPDTPSDEAAPEYDALAGEAVSAEEWTTIFEKSKYTNFSLSGTQSSANGSYTSEYFVDGNKAKAKSTSVQNGETRTYESYIAEEGEDSYEYYSEAEGIWIKEKGDAKVSAVYENTVAMFAGIYAQLTYDSAKKAYTATNITIQGQAIDYFEIKVANGKLLGYSMDFKINADNAPVGQEPAKISATQYAVYFAYGTTKVTLPEATKVDSGSQGGNQGGTDKYVQLTKDTDFSTLQSEKVTAAEWDKAFGTDGYTIYTASYSNQSHTCELRYMQGLSSVQMDADSMYYFDASQKGSLICYFVSGNKVEKQEVKSSEDGYEFMYYISQYSGVCSLFNGYFSEFTYDTAKGAYVFQSKKGDDAIETNSPLEGWTHKVVYAEVKIVNGKLAYVYVEDKDGNKETTKFYNYHATKVTLPQTTESAETK